MNDGTVKNTQHASTINIQICSFTIKHKYGEAEWQHNNDKGHLSGDGELNPPKYLLHSLSVTSPLCAWTSETPS